MRYSLPLVSLLALFCCGGGWFSKPANLAGIGADVDTGALLAWYKMDELAGTTTADSSGNGHAGTLVNAPVFTMAKFGNGLQFIGASSQKVSCGDIGLTSLVKCSVSLWFKRTSTGNIATFQAGPSNTDSLDLLVNSDGSIYVQVNNGSTAYIAFASNDTAWHHLAMAFDGSQTGNSARLRVYLDTVLKTTTYVGTIPASLASSGLTTPEIGHSTSDAAFATATMDSVRVYNRAITAQEVTWLFNNQ